MTLTEERIYRFFNSVLGKGHISWTTRFDDMTGADFGLALRIEEDLAAQNRDIALLIGISTLIISIFAIIILWNQRKIKKML